MGDEAVTGAGEPRTRLVQIGWQDQHGVMCDCPVYEASPHANSKPVYREWTVSATNAGTTPDV